VITAGIDFAADERKTCIATIDWSEDTARVVDLRLGASDEAILNCVRSGEKTGIDCQFGWPDKFVTFVVAHRDHKLNLKGVPMDVVARKDLAYRITDLEVKKIAGIQGLSVAADRIAMAAMRCAALLATLASEGSPVDRSGMGSVVEVYPAASLAKWGLTFKGYKTSKNLANLDTLVTALQGQAPWLELGAFGQMCRRSDDAIDAVLCALTAAASACGAIEPIPLGHLESAQREGWIAIPSEPLAQLASRVFDSAFVRTSEHL
jgi:predicted nuclease with RNAse H fold